MGKLVAVMLFALAVPAVVEAQCMKCYEPPSGQLYCGTTEYNGWASCQPVPNQNGCSMSGSCTGPSGDECGGRPHCIPDKWVLDLPLPDTAQWVVASVRIERPAAVAVPQQGRTRS